ncbi:protoporphyrinogen oxidase, putative [Phytophthora infestans T30-4]|uniref:Cilia- and flagella-associated protein 91 n=1 Tax=Phytophthora infestans (strain T30-4) TaxID=403677 RepID=D0MTF7_PHYIT|nr:protoporphyrinogen oxidase, putative [Phytophthora infestans T30-4]EEY61254.1 protoporphyrinogen oxidase, putative [Phytophthora infestans T30-4]|eukprot:XP_002908171.1 protoporphyrinogen oxidase, putative [Phytophthora infestans T30-4]
MLMAPAHNVVILGGGISGLTLAYFLRQALPKAVADSTRIRVLDASTTPGGWVQTAKRGGFLFEEGPRGFRPSRNGTEMLRLIEQLNLQDCMQAVDPAAQARYILRDGNVEKLPTSLLEVLHWPLSLDVARAALHEMFVKSGTVEDESIYKFISRRFSPLVAERLLDPMASGIFGGDIRKLSIRSCFPMLLDLEKKHGSVVKGVLFGGFKTVDKLLDGTNKSEFVKKHEKSVSVSFSDDSIENNPMADLQLNTKVTRLEVHGLNSASAKGTRFVVESKDPTSGEIREPIRASHLFSTIPACYLAPVVKDTAAGLAEALNEIKFVDMGMVHVGYNENVLTTDGFGYLIPSSEHEKNERKMQTRLSVMSGGAHFRDVASQPEGELERYALDALKRHLGITQKPDYVRAMAMTNGIPQYHVGFGQTLQRIEKQIARNAPVSSSGGSYRKGVYRAPSKPANTSSTINDQNPTEGSHLISGSERVKFHRRPVLPRLQAEPPEVLLAPTYVVPTLPLKHRDVKELNSPHVAAEVLEGATRSVSIQTIYRDSEAQTDPYTPDYTIQKTATGIPPEIEALVGLKYARGQLPIGHAELELIERNRNKRAFETSLPPMTDEASLLLRKAMLEAQETREWAYREAEIDAFHDQRADLLQQALAEREKENAFLSEQRLEALRQRLLHEKENALEAIQQERVTALRKLTKKRVERQHERGFGTPKPERGRDFIAEYANFGSQVYAPITRDGKAGKVKVRESGIGKPRFLQFDALRELESALPAQMVQPTAVQNMMFEGKERRDELIAELRAADDQLVLQRRNELALLPGSGAEGIDRVANAAKTRVEGEVVSEMFDFLSKELSRSREMAKMPLVWMELCCIWKMN